MLFAWHAPTLWSRYTTALRRLVAKTARTLGQDPKTLRVSYVRVVEMQRRAVPHIHGVARLDDRADPDTPPIGGIDGALLAELATRAAALVALDVARLDGEAHTLRFGVQADAKPITLSAPGTHATSPPTWPNTSPNPAPSSGSPRAGCPLKASNGST